MAKIAQSEIKRRVEGMKFLFKRRPKEGKPSKITPVDVIVYVHDPITSKFKKISVYSEVHSGIQDLAATLFRRGVVDNEGIVWASGSIVKVVPVATQPKEATEAAGATEKEVA